MRSGTWMHAFNPLPKGIILDWFKLKVFADDKLNDDFSHSNRAFENIVGKGENVGNQHFLLFPLCFQKPSISGSLKVGIVW